MGDNGFGPDLRPEVLVHFVPTPMLIGLVRTAGPLPPERLRTMSSSASWTVAFCSLVRLSSASTISTIGLLFVNQFHSCCPDWNSNFSVIVATLT